VALKKGEANLPKKSVVNISRIFTVNKSDLHRRRATNQKDIKTSAIMGGETKAAATG